jgi:cytochrome P450
MSLARMEARVGIGKLVARFRGVEPAGTPVRGNRARFRGFSHYPVRLPQ